MEIDDYGLMETRKCGCGFDDMGFFDHICNIRSYGKLTGEGVTLVGTDFTKIIEEVLPGKFGGASTDYQFLEEEDEKGLTRLSILVSPKIGQVKEKDILETLFQELKNRGHDRGFLPEIWTQANTIRVKRMNPISTKSGKTFAFHFLKERKEVSRNE